MSADQHTAILLAAAALIWLACHYGIRYALPMIRWEYNTRRHAAQIRARREAARVQVDAMRLPDLSADADYQRHVRDALDIAAHGRPIGDQAEDYLRRLP